MAVAAAVTYQYAAELQGVLAVAETAVLEMAAAFPALLILAVAVAALVALAVHVFLVPLAVRELW